MGLGAGSWGSWTGSWTGSWRESLARDSKQSKKLHTRTLLERGRTMWFSQWMAMFFFFIDFLQGQRSTSKRRATGKSWSGIHQNVILFQHLVQIRQIHTSRTLSSSRWRDCWFFYIHKLLSKEYTCRTQGVCLLENGFMLKYQEVDKLDTKSNFQKRTFWRKRRRGAYQRRSKDNRQIAR